MKLKKRITSRSVENVTGLKAKVVAFVMPATMLCATIAIGNAVMTDPDK